MTLQLELPGEIEKRLHAEAKRCGVDEADYALDAISRRLSAEGLELSETEAVLLREIDRGFSEDWWRHYEDLVNKREAGSLKEAEASELAVLTNALEEYNVRRMSCIAGVAKRHGVELKRLMEQLGIGPRVF